MSSHIRNVVANWANTPWRKAPEDSDDEPGVPVLVHRVRRKSFYVRPPDADAPQYAPILGLMQRVFSTTPLYFITRGNPWVLN